MFGGKLDTCPSLFFTCPSGFLYGPGSQLTLLPQCTLLKRGKKMLDDVKNAETEYKHKVAKGLALQWNFIIKILRISISLKRKNDILSWENVRTISIISVPTTRWTWDAGSRAASDCRAKHKYWTSSTGCHDQKADHWKMLAVRGKVRGGNEPKIC